MANHYSDEKNVQILVALLKRYGIKKIIASPGTTNMSFVISLQNDPYFEMYPSVDERSAAYLACGLADESGEPVVISCTGATASRNYLPGLTEAYYRKLPILAITSSQAVSKVGHHVAQVIDRSSLPNDVVNFSVALPIVKDDDDFWDCEIKVNKAILELSRRGGGPVHINLPTTYNKLFSVTELPSVKKIERITNGHIFPKLGGRVAVFIGSHSSFSKNEARILDAFCAANDAVVLCDHTSGYKGRYRVLSSLLGCQHSFDSSLAPDIVISIGEITGDYYNMAVKSKQIWRVSDDGELRDTYKKLRYVFEMSEQQFFEYYTNSVEVPKDQYLKNCKSKFDELSGKIPELPFSNIWLASKMAHRIPDGSTIHFGILNSLRSWNFFELPLSVRSASNVGGFGIDGGLSSLIGASFANRNKLYFCVIGDLAFFYDMNVLGNRSVGNNLRILLVNNGKGTEFRQYKHHASGLGDEADEFVAAAGHFGNKSRQLAKHYAEDLGFDYLSAESKDGFDEVVDKFLVNKVTEKSILFEVFTNSEEEAEALKAMMNIEIDVKEKAKETLKQFVGNSNLKGIKKIFGR
ncbi:thiamine pyrophosphate-binding protein [Runella salmonicolor]|uniref:Thiamine pyrophosphate-binding protein n=1 Tax=Runella salmonicolor TaxID=2950278 RepID=A0ABT1FJT4_9BACT|nr:thiamine pyrophosphate-binding protein [Runella salmonicolor]MCP1382036.1 thiamine pyrophosphate-binding protein [Runella salmonicolor]